MCVLFVVGVMNLLWIAALSVLVLVERSGRAGALAARFRSRSCARRCFALILNWATFWADDDVSNRSWHSPTTLFQSTKVVTTSHTQEARMSTNEVRSNDATMARVDMKFEVVVIPVSDVDRAKEFYGRLGWRLDADYDNGDDFRVIQFTPPGSGCSVIFGKNVTAAAPGSAQGLYLIVSDIEAARDELVAHGVDASEVFHDAGGVYAGTDQPYLFGRLRVSGPDPEHRSYRSFVSFSDPDGNGWLLQEVTTRLAWACRRRHDVRVGGRPVAGAAARRGRARAARGADGASRPELAGLVRRVHGARAGRRRTAEMNDYGVIVIGVSSADQDTASRNRSPPRRCRRRSGAW